MQRGYEKSPDERYITPKTNNGSQTEHQRMSKMSDTSI